jgi:hypothetical protein
LNPYLLQYLQKRLASREHQQSALIDTNQVDFLWYVLLSKKYTDTAGGLKWSIEIFLKRQIPIVTPTDGAKVTNANKNTI